MELAFATSNRGKMQTMERDLRPFGIHVRQKPLDIPEPRSNDVQEIADYKVHSAFQKLQRPVIVMDAGFYIDSLNGFPRAFVNFALETIGLDGILRLVNGQSRTCEFRECLAYLDAKLDQPKFFIAHVRGTLATEPRGKPHDAHWSELALVFVPDELTTTLAEMSSDQLDAWRASTDAKDPHAKEFPNWLLQHRG